MWDLILSMFYLLLVPGDRHIAFNSKKSLRIDVIILSKWMLKDASFQYARERFRWLFKGPRRD